MCETGEDRTSLTGIVPPMTGLVYLFSLVFCNLYHPLPPGKAAGRSSPQFRRPGAGERGKLNV